MHSPKRVMCPVSRVVLTSAPGLAMTVVWSVVVGGRWPEASSWP